MSSTNHFPLAPKMKKGFLLVVSAPSGTGKTSLCDRLAEEFPFIARSISMTTRPQRQGEINRRDYEFVSPDEFKKRETADELLETAQVFGNWYGTPRAPVEKAIAEGKTIVMDIDTVGAFRLRKSYPKDSVLVFVLPPTIDELTQRLKNRGKNTPEELHRRLQEAEQEISQAEKYDYVMVNASFHDAFDQLKSIVFAERARRIRLELDHLANLHDSASKTS